MVEGRGAMLTQTLCSFRVTYCRTQYLRALFYSSQPESIRKNNIAKVVNVAILGAPNCGKSTLINKIVERKVLLVFLFYCNNITSIAFIGGFFVDLRSIQQSAHNDEAC